ncbi:esterase/lipase family protein [Streptomyces sp. P1-3]|uniref:esterase/lipase family protein n=1 Tax=Streptomyces sp. P1-3 TaxID=3421658 RepID=UPI003D3608EF
MADQAARAEADAEKPGGKAAEKPEEESAVKPGEESAERAIATFGFIRPPEATVIEPAPRPDAMWALPNGTAWVYYGDGHDELVRPVILADGFNSGPSDLNGFWEAVERGAYPFATELRRRGHDLVLVGYGERSRSILENAEAVRSAVLESIARRRGDAPLSVGGFGMGGLVARYALAGMEHERVDHQTAVYVSYDSPHRGAWVPIALQAFAHYIRPLKSGFSRQINSDAARQLLWRHIPEVDSPPNEHDERKKFLAALREVGWWPMRPVKIGVANGRSDGTGNGIPAGAEALKATGLVFRGTTLSTQAAGDGVAVGELRSILALPATVKTNGLPELDGAPGGTLDSFGILADELNKLGRATVDWRSVCFVPTVSAVAIRDLDRQDHLYIDVDSLPPGQSELDEFACASENGGHAVMTEELGGWILDRLPK